MMALAAYGNGVKQQLTPDMDGGETHHTRLCVICALTGNVWMNTLLARVALSILIEPRLPNGLCL